MVCCFDTPKRAWVYPNLRAGAPLASTSIGRDEPLTIIVPQGRKTPLGIERLRRRHAARGFSLAIAVSAEAAAAFAAEKVGGRAAIAVEQAQVLVPLLAFERGFALD